MFAGTFLGIIIIFSFALTPELISDLSHLFSQFCYKPILESVTVVQEPSSLNITLVPLVTLARLHPVRWCIPCLHSPKIYNAFNESSRDLEIKFCNTKL